MNAAHNEVGRIFASGTDHQGVVELWDDADKPIFSAP